MPRFKEKNFDQHMLLPVNLSEQLVKGTMEYTINQVIDRLDMTKFNEHYRNEETGAPAFDPRVLLKIVLFAYSRGILSSRRIANAASTNITFIALSGYNTPDFTTIANFVSTMEAEIGAVFLHVLRVCDKMELIGGERFAIDGHKLSSNAAKEWSGTHLQLQKKILKMKSLIEELGRRHSEMDSKEEKEVVENKADKFVKRVEKIERFLKTHEPKAAARGKGRQLQSNVTDNESAKIISSHGVVQGYNGLAVADAKNQVIVAASAHGTTHEGQLLQPMLELTKSNLSEVDPTAAPLADKELLLDANYFSEANLKILADEKIDAYVPDPMFRKRDPRFADADSHKGKTKKNVFDTVKSQNKRGFGQDDFTYDAGGDFYLCKSGYRLNRWGDHATSGGREYGIEKIAYCRECQLRSLCMPGANAKSKKMITVADTVSDSRRLPFSTAMKAKIDSAAGKKIYSDRMRIIEPVFANTRAHKGMNKFTLRGRAKVNIQWQLYMIVHNLSKIAMAEKRIMAAAV